MSDWQTRSMAWLATRSDRFWLTVIVLIGFAGLAVAVVAGLTVDSPGRRYGIVIFFVWLWLSNMALLYGAELNAELDRERAPPGA